MRHILLGQHQADGQVAPSPVQAFTPHQENGIQDAQSFSRWVIERYQERVAGVCLQYPQIQHISLLGSFGRQDATVDSDMDPWIICDNGLDLGQMANISRAEWSIRQSMADDYQLSHLARHRASLFSLTEATFYRRAFLVRVEIPRRRGEHHVVAQPGGALTDSDFSARELCIDTVVSIDEFATQLRTAIQAGPSEIGRQKKWSRRILQELHVLDTGGLEPIIPEQRAGHILDALSCAETYLQTAGSKLDALALSRRILAHKLMWNVEKVRWELFQSLANEAHFHHWRQAQGVFFGFPPVEIEALAQRIQACLGGDNAHRDLDEHIALLTIDHCSMDQIHAFHAVWQDWLHTHAHLLLARE